MSILVDSANPELDDAKICLDIAREYLIDSQRPGNYSIPAVQQAMAQYKKYETAYLSILSRLSF